MWLCAGRLRLACDAVEAAPAHCPSMSLRLLACLPAEQSSSRLLRLWRGAGLSSGFYSSNPPAASWPRSFSPVVNIKRQVPPDQHQVGQLGCPLLQRVSVGIVQAVDAAALVGLQAGAGGSMAVGGLGATAIAPCVRSLLRAVLWPCGPPTSNTKPLLHQHPLPLLTWPPTASRCARRCRWALQTG